MDSIKYILGALKKLIIVLIIAWAVIFIVSIFFPNLNIKNLILFRDTLNKNNNSSSDTPISSWLPAPGSLSLTSGKNNTPNENSNVYKPGAPYSGYSNAYNNNTGGAQVSFVTYSSTGEQIVTGNNPVNTPSNTIGNTSNINNGYSNKSGYIRNLSIYEGGHIYTGISFIGEAKNTMFQNGKFPVVIVDQNGRVATVVIAEATSNWSAPGWARFQVKINGVLPNKTTCTMVFQSGVMQNGQPPVRVAIPILCN